MIQLLRTRDGSLVWETAIDDIYDWWSDALAVSSNGQFLAIGGNHLSVFKVQDGRLAWQEDLNGATIAVRFSPSATRLVVLTRTPLNADAVVSVFDAQTGWPACKSEHWHVERACFSPDGKTVAAATSSGDLSVHRAEDGSLQWQTGALYGWRVETLSFSPDGSRIVAIASDGDKVRVLVFAAEDGQPLTETVSDAESATLAFGPAGEIVVAFYARNRSVIRVCYPEADRAFEVPFEAEVKDLQLSPDATLLAVTTWSGNILVYSARDGRLRWVRVGLGRSGSMTWSPDGTVLAVWNEERLALWESEDGRLRWQVGLEGVPQALAFSPVSPLVAVALLDHLQVFDAAKGVSCCDVTLNHIVEPLVFSPDGARLAVGGIPGFCEFAVRDGRPLRQVKPESAVYSLSYSPDGSRLMVIGDFGLQMWDVPGVAE